jgi:YD repeat-containing protein
MTFAAGVKAQSCSNANTRCVAPTYSLQQGKQMEFVRRIFVMLLIVVLGPVATTTQAQTTYYGAPYATAAGSLYKGPFATIAEVVQSYNAFLYQFYQIPAGDCPVSYVLTGNGATTNQFALMYENSQPYCGGGPEGISGTAYLYSPSKNIGHPSCICAGDPINIGTGNEFHEEMDARLGRLNIERYYNSNLSAAQAEMGPQWRHSFDRSLLLTNSSDTPGSALLPPDTAVLYRPDGLQETFTKSDGIWTSDPDVTDTLTETDNAQGVATSYTIFVAATREFEAYNTAGLLQTVTDENGQSLVLSYSTASTPSSVAPSAGLLLTVTDPEGRQLNFSYNSSGQLFQITQPDGGTIIYGYNATTGNLTTVQYPDATSRQYSYSTIAMASGVSFSGALTGVVDEAGNDYVSLSYDADGRGTQSSSGGGANTVSLTYLTNNSTSVTYPLGLTTTVNFSALQGRMKVTSVNKSCSPACAEPVKAESYDTNGNPASTTDFNGNVTATTYDSVGLLTQQIDAQGSPAQRTTSFTWNTTLRVPLTRTVSNASGTLVSSTQWVYNAAGQMLARCDIDPTNSATSGYSCSSTGTVPAGVRRSTYAYCTAVGTGCPIVGLLLTATGPRTDLTQTTTYTYYTTSSATNCGTPGAACYQPGDVYQVTDALGHVTTIASYDADGRITRITDANGVNTDMTYTPRGWLASRTVGGATTRFTYTAYGAVQTVTDPDGVTTTYGYDSAHRLTTITDALGNDVQYTLDAAGDKTGEQVYNTTGTLHKSLSRTFNTLGQLTTVVDGLSHTVFNASATTSYDANGNLIQNSDALGIQRQQGYDALNRLVQTIDNYNGVN